jgi:NADPH2:quinone reductase
VRSLRHRGRCITVGNAGRDPQPFDVSLLPGDDLSLTGVFFGGEIATERVREMVQRHVDDVAAGRLDAVVDRTFPLSEAAAAHAYIESRQAFGRVVLVP